MNEKKMTNCKTAMDNQCGTKPEDYLNCQPSFLPTPEDLADSIIWGHTNVSKNACVKANDKLKKSNPESCVNEKGITNDHKIISNASCTTNCLAPVAKILNELVGIESGFMTTVHAFTGDQPVLDTLHSDLRRARAASSSMIPTSTGAAKAVGLVLPELSGKLDGTAVRVPTVNVSMVDLTFYAQKATSIEEINKSIKDAASGSLSGVLTYNNAPLVSIDFNHNPASSNFDATQTQVVKEKLVRVLSWYDNEWGFSNRMADVAVLMGK